MSTVDVPKQLISLLFLRECWGLEVFPEVPPPRIPVPKHDLHAGRTRDELEQSWSTMWEETARWETLKVTVSPEGMPDWRKSFGSEGIDAQARGQWVKAAVDSVMTPLMKEVSRGKRGTVEQNLPEHAAAVRNGLETVLLLPVAGSYYRWLSPSHLLLSCEARLDNATYREALSARP